MSEYYRMFLRTAEEGVIERRTDINTGEEALYSNGKFIASSSGRTDFGEDLLVEKVRSEPHIIAFGAGHIGKALYDLAVRCGIPDASGFAERFIHYERQVRSHGGQTADL